MITTEPAWDAEDRAIIYALEEYEADLCPGCGQPLSESLHVEGRPDPKYTYEYAVCIGCVVKERGQAKKDREDAAQEKAGSSPWRNARRWLLRKLS